MIGNLAGCRATVVAGLAVGCESGVIEAGRAPCKAAVTCAAVLSRRHVIARYARCPDTRMAGAAGTTGTIDSRLRHQVDARVFHANRVKGVRRVACIAVVVTLDVAGILAHGLHAVVTTETGTSYLQVIHMNDRQEVILGVASLAVVLRQDVGHRTRSRAHSRPRCMAANARPGCALEDALQMAVFACEIAVEAAQLIARSQVIKLSPLDRCGMRQQEQAHDQEHCRGDCACSPDHE